MSKKKEIQPVEKKVEVPVEAKEMETKKEMKDNEMSFEIDPYTVKAPQYAVEEINSYFNQFVDEKSCKPNVMYINSFSLQKLGFRDSATDLGLNIKESNGYDENELILGVEL